MHLENNNILFEEQKGCRLGSMGCKEQLLIDSVVSKQAFSRHRNLHICYLDYQKAFDSVPHSWLQEILEIYKINSIFVNFLRHTMYNWNTNLNLNINGSVIKSQDISIKRGIFQGDSLSPLWFCMALNPLSRLLQNSKLGFGIRNNGKVEYLISHLLYMDDIKLYATNQLQLDKLIKITKNFSDDINMKFGIDKCKVLHIHRGKVLSGDCVIDQNEIIESMTAEQSYKYLGFYQNRLIQHSSIKAELKEKFEQRLKLILKTKLNSKNLIRAVNSFVMPVVSYSLGIINWSDTDILAIERLVRTQFTKHNCHHPKSSVIRFSLSRKEGGRGIIDLSNLRFSQLNHLRNYFYSKLSSPLHLAIINADDNLSPLNLLNRNLALNLRIVSNANKKLAILEKFLHGTFYKELSLDFVNASASISWLKGGYLFPETEGFILAIQDRVIKTKNYRKFIMKDTSLNDHCRRCYRVSETIDHIVSGCSVLAGVEYVRRHNNVCNIIHQKLINLGKLLVTVEPYYKYKPDSVVENSDFKIYYDRTIITDKSISHNRPDIVWINKTAKITYLIDISVPNTNNLQQKYSEKLQKYTELSFEIKKMWKMSKVYIVPLIISATGIVPNSLLKNLELLKLSQNLVIEIQKSVILNTCSIVRKFLNDYDDAYSERLNCATR